MLPAPAAPVGAVIQHGAARRIRLWIVAASGLAAVALAVPLLSSHTVGRCGGGGRQYLTPARPAGLTVTRAIAYDRAGQAIARW